MCVNGHQCNSDGGGKVVAEKQGFNISLWFIRHVLNAKSLPSGTIMD